MSHPASFGRRCLQCDYDLRGSLQSRCCPECGWQFHPSTIVLECWSFSEWPRLWNLPFYAIVTASMLALLALGSILASGWWRVGCALLAGVYLALAIRGMKSYFQLRSRTAPDRLVLFRRTFALFRSRRSRVSVRWHELERQHIRRLRNNYWRLTVFNPYRVADVVVHGDRRFIARLRSEIKRRRQKANRFRRLPPSPEPAFPDAPGVPMRGIAKKFPKKGNCA